MFAERFSAYDNDGPEVRTLMEAVEMRERLSGMPPTAAEVRILNVLFFRPFRKLVRKCGHFEKIRRVPASPFYNTQRD